MKRIAALLTAVAIAVSGCSASSESTLLDWVSEAGLPVVIQNSTNALSQAVQDLQDLTVTTDNIDEIVTALKTSAVALSVQAKALATEPVSSDAAFEQLRTKALDSIQTFVATAEGLDAAALIAAGDLATVSAAIGALTAIATDLTSLTQYIDSHSGDQVGPSEG